MGEQQKPDVETIRPRGLSLRGFGFCEFKTLPTYSLLRQIQVSEEIGQNA